MGRRVRLSRRRDRPAGPVPGRRPPGTVLGVRRLEYDGSLAIRGRGDGAVLGSNEVSFLLENGKPTPSKGAASIRMTKRGTNGGAGSSGGLGRRPRATLLRAAGRRGRLGARGTNKRRQVQRR